MVLALLVFEEGHDKYPASAPDARSRADSKNGGCRGYKAILTIY